MFNARVTVRHATGEAERRHLSDEAEFRLVLRDEFGLNMTDAEIRTCIDVMRRKGEKGRRIHSLHERTGSRAEKSGFDDVRFGSKADIGASLYNVCFTPESGHGSAQ
jgi:hypothetical protein